MPQRNPDASPSAFLLILSHWNFEFRIFFFRRALLHFLLLFLAVLPLGSCSCSRSSTRLDPPPAGAPVLRVLLADGAESVRVAIDGPYQVFAMDNAKRGRKLAAGPELAALTVQAAAPDIIVGDIIRTASPVEFVPDRVPVKVNGRLYRGSLRVSPSGGGVRAINLVDLDGYLRGVVPCEVNSAWPLAALQAQAVAARTYAMARAEERSREPYDLVTTTGDQVYGGFDRESPRCDSAVTTTTGCILRYRFRPFVAFFHSCCGGMTADSRSVFPTSTAQIPGATCGYCTAAPHYHWTLSIPRAEIAGRLGVPGLVSITPGAATADGRVGEVYLKLANGSTTTLSGPAFRQRLGYEKLKSTRFTMSLSGSNILFEGRGWGHGVGLCQWGAKGMAEAGKTYGEILEKYYPGARLNRMY